MASNTSASLTHPEWDEILACYNPALLPRLDPAHQQPVYHLMCAYLPIADDDLALLTDMYHSSYWRFQDIKHAWVAMGILAPWHGLLP